MDPRRSPLAGEHASLGARMVTFGGWEMPLAYPIGTLAEHMACRSGAAAFDVSHLGTVRVEGPGARDRLQTNLSNDLGKIDPGRAQYSHLLDPADASVVDDVIVWWVDDERFDVMPNASNTGAVLDALGGGDVTAERAVVAVQGPASRTVLGQVCPVAAEVGRFAVTAFDWGDSSCLAAGTGYTGEDGVECAVPRTAAPQFWAAVLAEGAVAAGLGARDTLRLEAGLPLHGHELGPGITPLQAGLGWVVGWGKGDFRGRSALEDERRTGVDRRLLGLLASGRQPPRAGQPVLSGAREVGTVTSGNFSPCLGRGIGLALLESAVQEGETVAVDARRHRIEAVVVSPPFVEPGGSPRAAVAAGDGAPGGR